jgi:hypothetical protein
MYNIIIIIRYHPLMEEEEIQMEQTHKHTPYLTICDKLFIYIYT